MARVLEDFALDSGSDVGAGDTLTVGVDITPAQAAALAYAGHVALDGLNPEPAGIARGVLATEASPTALDVRVRAMHGFCIGGGNDLRKNERLVVTPALARLWEAQGKVVASPLVPVTVTLGATPAEAVHGADVTLTATLSPDPKTGTVQFYADAVALGDPVALSHGAATLVVKTLAVGEHSITAGYAGGGVFSDLDAAVSDAATVTITEA